MFLIAELTYMSNGAMRAICGSFGQMWAIIALQPLDGALRMHYAVFCLDTIINICYANIFIIVFQIIDKMITTFRDILYTLLFAISVPFLILIQIIVLCSTVVSQFKFLLKSIY